MYEIQRFYELSETGQLNQFLSGEVDTAMALDWSKLIQNSSETEIDLIFLKILKQGKVVGIVTFMRLKKLDTYSYLWPPLSKLIHNSTLFKQFFPQLAIGFLEIPIANYSGLLTATDMSKLERQAILEQVTDYLHKQVSMHALCIKEESNAINGMEDRFSELSFLPNTALKIEHDTFAAYLKSLPSKKRRKLLSDRKVLFKTGGAVEISHNPSEISSELYALYQKTTDRKKKDDDYIQTPLAINKAFFSQLSAYKNLKPLALFIRIDDEIIAYCLLMQSGNTLFFKSVGLDYDKSYATRAYFNLFYAAIEYAIEHSCKKIDFGMTSYCFKKRMGCTLHPSSYYVEFYHPALRFFRKTIVFLLGLKFSALEF